VCRKRTGAFDKGETVPENLMSKLAHLLLILCISLFAGLAMAGGFYEKDGAALRGYDPVAYFTEGGPKRGSPDFKSSYQGSEFHFASAANRDTFAANPEKYAPQYGGYCAYGLTRGYKAATDPAAFKVVDGKLYLNYNAQVQEIWNKDVPGFVKTADAKWPEVAKQTKVIE
jgi:YHS domain-containing protein